MTSISESLAERRYNLRVRSISRQQPSANSYRRCIVKSLPHMGVEAASRAAFSSSRRCKCVTSVWSRTAQALLAVAAIEVGVWAGLEVSPLPRGGTISLVPRVGEASSRSVKEIEAEAPLPSDCVQISRVESDGKSFAAFSRRTGHPRVQTASRGGSADVFDKQGRLARHYAATEHADNSWDLIELIRVTPDCAIAAHIR